MQTIRRRKAHTAETTGVFTVLVGSARDHHRIQSAFDLVLRDHNLHVALDSANQLSTLGERRRAEFGDLVDDPVFAPLFHESHRSYLKHRRMANGPLRRKSSTRLKTVRAVGYLREILEASLARENGLPGAVIDGRWKRNPNGTFVCQAVMQGDPQPLDLWSWQKGLARPTHSVDVGMSFTEEGLAVSAQPIRNTLIRRGPTKTLLGKPVPARVDSTEDFRVDDPARKPKRYLIPHDVVVRPGFVETLLGTLKGKHSIRTSVSTAAWCRASLLNSGGLSASLFGKPGSEQRKMLSLSAGWSPPWAWRINGTVTMGSCAAGTVATPWKPFRWSAHTAGSS